MTMCMCVLAVVEAGYQRECTTMLPRVIHFIIITQCRSSVNNFDIASTWCANSVCHLQLLTCLHKVTIACLLTG